MANSKIEKLSSSKILSLHSKTFTQKVINVQVGETVYAVTIDVKFQPTKLQAMILELVEKYQHISKLDDVLDISYYANFLLLKYFTDLGLEKVDDFNKQLKVFKGLVDLEIFDKVVDGFDPVELEKVNVYIKKIGENLKKVSKDPQVMEDIQQMVSEISQIENKEILGVEQE